MQQAQSLQVIPKNKEIDLNRLNDFFRENEIEWRIRTAGTKKTGEPWGRALAYITNRAIMDRLDFVCGMAGWRNQFRYLPDGGVLCGISIKIEGEWITKWDGAEPNVSDSSSIDALKSALSRAMKRAAIQWGMGRYLYELKENFVQVKERGKGRYFQPPNDKKGIPGFSWDPPPIPPQFLPKTGNSGRPPQGQGGARISAKSIKTIRAITDSHIFSQEEKQKAEDFIDTATEERAQKFIESLRKHERLRKHEQERKRQAEEKEREKQDKIETAIETYKTPENVQARIDTLKKKISMREMDSQMTNSGQARQEALRGNDADQKEINLLMRAIAEMKTISEAEQVS